MMSTIQIIDAEIKKEVRAYILQAVHVDKEKIRNDSLIFREGYFDSMGFIMLITFIEEKFKIKTGDEDLTEENFESIEAIAGFIARKLHHNICAE
jgi:acyl carrier protein